jgi:hypothetical protein
MRFSFLPILFLAILFSACNSGGDQNANEAASIDQQKEVSEYNQTKKSQLPPLSRDWFDRLVNEVDYIDFIFYNQDFSLSLNERESVMQFLGGIGLEHVVQDPNCPSQGRIFMQVQGNEIMAADIHFIDNQCAYLVFLIGNKPMYANKLNQNGEDVFRAYFGAKNQLKRQ